MPLKIKPCHLRAAREYVGRYHRHSIPPVGGKFAVACYDGNDLCGVAICGRPVARYLDDGLTLEILRCCTDGTDNACSKLYGAYCRIGFDMGYRQAAVVRLYRQAGRETYPGHQPRPGGQHRPDRTRTPETDALLMRRLC